MLKHTKNTRTQYEYTLTQNGQTVFTLWTHNKSVNKIIRLAIEKLDNIAKGTNTNPTEWTTCQTGIENIPAGITGKFTGRTLLEVRGYTQ